MLKYAHEKRNFKTACYRSLHYHNFFGGFCCTAVRKDRQDNLIATYKEAIDQKITQFHGTLTGENTDLVASWMTFDYINKIFNLPSDYLKNSLAISDASYPRISISRYEKNHKLDQNQFLAEVKKTVANYFTAK